MCGGEGFFFASFASVFMWIFFCRCIRYTEQELCHWWLFPWRKKKEALKSGNGIFDINAVIAPRMGIFAWETKNSVCMFAAPSCEEKRIRPTSTTTTAKDSFPRLGIAVRHRKRGGIDVSGGRRCTKLDLLSFPKGGMATKVVGQLLLRPRGGGGTGRKKGPLQGSNIYSNTHYSRVYATPTLSHTLSGWQRQFTRILKGGDVRGATYTTGGKEGRDLYLTYYDEGAAALGHMMSQRRLWRPDAFYACVKRSV